MSRIDPDSHDDRRRGHYARRHEPWRQSRFEFIVSGPAGPEDTASQAAVHVAAVGDLDRAAEHRFRSKCWPGSFATLA